jgi:lipoprotein-anchoring transpeptidase ErfK/SrfK
MAPVAAAPAAAAAGPAAAAVTSLGHASVAGTPVAAARVASAPVASAPAASAAPVSARQSSSAVKPHPKKSARTKTPVPGAPAFSDLEADFFAREADLYKNDGGDTFDDLDGGGGKPRPVRAEGSRGVRSRKK